MSDAPETIWAWVHEYNHYNLWAEKILPDVVVIIGAKKYRRDDLPITTEQIMSEPRVKVLADARKAHLTAIEIYNEKLAIVRVARTADDWNMNADQEFAAADDARKHFIKAAESFCDAVIEEPKE